MEHDNIKQIPTAVYHYSASTTLHGRLFDGVIERPIIFSADCYQQVRREIASRIGANAHQVQVHSISFIGESTPAQQPPAQPGSFIAADEQQKALVCIHGATVVSVTSISFSELKKGDGGECTMSGDIEWSDGVKRTHYVAMGAGHLSNDCMNAERLRRASTVCRSRILEFACTMCEPDNLPHR